MRQAFDQAEIDLYWQLARRVVSTLHRLKGASRPVPFVETSPCRRRGSPIFWCDYKTRSNDTGLTASLYGHVGHGQLHVRPFLNLSDAADVGKMEHLATDLYREVLEVEGTIGGEHGDGLSRTAYVRQQYGDLYNVFRDIKWTFDPLGILNPGKIVSDDPGLMTRDLRPLASLVQAATTASNGSSGAVPVAAAAGVDLAAANLVAKNAVADVAKADAPAGRIRGPAIGWTLRRWKTPPAKMQRLRQLPFATGRRADVPGVSRPAGRNLAAGQGQSDA